MKVGEIWFRTVEMGCMPISITFVGTQWFKWIDDSGVPGREQIKFAKDPADSRYFVSDKFFNTGKEAIENERLHLSWWRQDLEIDLDRCKEKESILAKYMV